PKTWWTAQALFYDLPLPTTSNIAQIRQLLERTLHVNSLKVSEDTSYLESKANSGFNNLNNQILEKSGLANTDTSTKGAGTVSKVMSASPCKYKLTQSTKSTPNGTGFEVTSGENTASASRLPSGRELPKTLAVKRSALGEYQSGSFIQLTKRAKLATGYGTEHEEPRSQTSQRDRFSQEDFNTQETRNTPPSIDKRRNMPKAADAIVIPPLAVGEFTCIGGGLLHDGHARESLESLRMLLLPAGTGEAITDRSRPKSWWLAQAIHYDLPCSKYANIAALRAQLEAALRANTLALPAKMKTMENKANREFKQLNKEVLEKTGQTNKQSKITEKAPKATAKSAAKGEVKVSKTTTTAKKVTEAARNSSTQDEPRGKGKGKAKRSADEALDDAAPSPQKCVKTSSTQALLTPSSEKAGNRKLVALRDEPDVWEVAPGPSTPKAKQTAKRTAPIGSLLPLPSSGGANPPVDCVTGSWTISCPYVEGEWQMCTDLGMNVVRTHARQHIEANFDLGIAHGVLRSKKMEGRSDGGVYVTFEWVGEENNGPVLPPSASRCGYIKFSRDSDTAFPICKGKIQGLPACGSGGVEFSAVWQGPAGKNGWRWDDFDEEAYEDANRDRWY
ncbi:hypothetical protein FRB99_002498, partial [Tulasnella sp. 403]